MRKSTSKNSVKRAKRCGACSLSLYHLSQAAEKVVQIASCGRGSESVTRKINRLPSRDRRKRSFQPVLSILFSTLLSSHRGSDPADLRVHGCQCVNQSPRVDGSSTHPIEGEAHFDRGHFVPEPHLLTNQHPD
jgi:hypothetical protein